MSAFTLTIDSDHIAWLSFDLPKEKVNKFSPEVLQELSGILDTVAQNKELRALAIKSGKKDVFIAGADIKAIEAGFENPQQILSFIELGHKAFNKIQNLPFPSFALIDGVCVGGGMELALACTYRYISDNPKTTLGLPETSLGIFPGWGGTQRMPRLIGLEEGLGMILAGKTIKAIKAWKIHLADGIAPAEFFDPKAKAFIAYALTDKGREQILKQRKRDDLKTMLLEKNPLGRKLIFWQARKNLLSKTKGHYPAPVVALDLIERTYGLPLAEGLKEEEKLFSSSATSLKPVAKNMIHLFFTSEALKKYTGVPENILPVEIRSTAVLGAGTMGGTIAWLLSNKDYPVRLKDINYEALSKGYATANSLYSKMVKERRLKSTEAIMKFHNLSATTDYSGFKNIDLVIEAAVENLELKQQIFAEMENYIRPDTIVASNTSSLTIAEMGANMKHPERLVGMHFFNPPNKMPLVEVVKGPKTSDEAVATAVSLCKKLGKTPLVVGDCHGFLVNRIFAISANESLALLEEGVPMDKLETTMLRFGMPMGPFTLADEVGNDVSYKVSLVFEKAYGERMRPPELIKKLYDNKLFGKKVGKGFYIYEGKSKKENPEIRKLLPRAKVSGMSETEIRDRIVLAMINEAARCLQENIIDTPEHLDMALIMGIGFPPFRGGLLRYADELGIDYIVKQLNGFAKSEGAQFTPCELLLDMQKNNQKFYDAQPQSVKIEKHDESYMPR